MKKLVSILMAIMMIAMVGAAFATDADNVYSGSGDTLATSVANGTTIPLKKSIVFFNANGSNVYEPNITYTYTVEPHNPNGATVTDDGKLNDNHPVTVTVNTGITDGVKFNSGANQISFSSGNNAVAALSTGTEVEHSTNLTVDLTKFQHAGIYRYKITETTESTAKNAVGIIQGSNFNAVRYLDVYIANDTSGLKLVGAVIFKTTVTTSGSEGTDSITTSTEKTTGFAPGTDATTGTTDYSSETQCDLYTTYDFTISKTVTGGMADKTHEFPFYVTVTNTINGAAYTYIKDTTGSESPATATQDATTTTKFTAGETTQTVGSDAKTSALKLKDGESITFKGLPSNTSSALSVMVKEYNDTVDQYTASVKATVGGTTNISLTTDPATGIMTASTGTAALASAFDIKTNDATSQTIAVTNNVSEISPTGYVSRFAPYALILVAGIALLIVAKKRKPAKDDEE